MTTPPWGFAALDRADTTGKNHERYSPFFETIAEGERLQLFGMNVCGYSVLRAVTDPSVAAPQAPYPMYAGRPTGIQCTTVALLWDEDYDRRVLWVVEKLYSLGFFPYIKCIGEYQGNLLVIPAARYEGAIDALTQACGALCGSLPDDRWSLHVEPWDDEKYGPFPVPNLGTYTHSIQMQPGRAPCRGGLK